MKKTMAFLGMAFLMCCLLTACQSADTPSTTTKNTSKEIEPSEIDYAKKLKELDIELPTMTAPIANYVHIAQSDKLLFLAGKGPKKNDGEYIKGKLGDDLSVEQGYEAARIVGINQLAVLKSHLGDLNKVKRIVKVTGMVNANSEFENHPEVINGFSDLMVQVFGEKGKHARAAVGMNSLPRNICVEIDMIVEIY